MTLERAHVRRRDGQRLDEAGLLAAACEPPEATAWQKVTVYAGEQSRHRGRPLSSQLVRALRQAGAAGATSLRGVWGYHGDHPPHGDSSGSWRAGSRSSPSSSTRRSVCTIGWRSSTG